MFQSLLKSRRVYFLEYFFRICVDIGIKESPCRIGICVKFYGLRRYRFYTTETHADDLTFWRLSKAARDPYTRRSIVPGSTTYYTQFINSNYIIRSIFYKDLSNRVLVRSCLLYTSPSPRDRQKSRMPSSA